MNQSLLLHIVQKLEGFMGKLPDSIQKPVLRELTPLKELFLEQRAARLVLVGPGKLPLQDLLHAVTAAPVERYRDLLLEIFRWQDLSLGNNGLLAVLDARGADTGALDKITGALQTRPADLFLFVEDGEVARPSRKAELENLAVLLKRNSHPAGVVGIVTQPPADPRGNGQRAHTSAAERLDRLQAALIDRAPLGEHLLGVVEAPLFPAPPDDDSIPSTLAGLLIEHVPNQARVEMIRVMRDRTAQVQIAQTLVKSTSAICAAIGAQPIPLADLPVLTTLQLVMVSGIMQLSGRERSLRAATEFLAALGVNVGAGMLLREGARAILKVFPGWGNVVSGMVAGAGTYGLGRAAIAYFIENLTLQDARRTYLKSRKKAPRHALPGRNPTRKEGTAERL